MMSAISCDVVVVGAGIAGFSAAVRAAEMGVVVVLLDKSNGPLGDGNTLMTSGSFRAGGRNPRSQPNELYESVMAEGVAYPDLVKGWAENCGRAVEWLVHCGVTLSEPTPGRIWLEPGSAICLGPVYKKDVGTRALAAMKTRFEQLGGHYRNNLNAVKLIHEREHICGVVALKGNEIVEFRGASTILSTGGFSANKEMVRRYIGKNADHCKLRGSKRCTGDGLRMALEVGAKGVNLQYFYGHLLSRKALTDDRFWPYPRLDSFVDEGMLVDPNGNRFVDEGRGDVAVANELARCTDVTGATLIFDHATWEGARDDVQDSNLKTPAPNPWLFDNDGELYCHKSVEGLAEAIGVNRENLAATLGQYNRALRSKASVLLAVPRSGKAKPLRAPFYGLRVVPGITFTMGGVLVNGHGEVLNRQEMTIPGLYAAGDAIGGLMGGYRGGYTGGLTQAVVTGMLAGEAAARSDS
jgi:succinate dehydrogenase/fumarate reductase flavoprotein subunit